MVSPQLHSIPSGRTRLLSRRGGGEKKPENQKNDHVRSSSSSQPPHGEQAWDTFSQWCEAAWQEVCVAKPLVGENRIQHRARVFVLLLTFFVQGFLLQVFLSLPLDVKYHAVEVDRKYFSSAKFPVNPQTADEHVELGEMREEKKKYALAEKSYEAALKQDPQHAWAFAKLGGVKFVMRKDLEGAEKDLLAAQDLDPSLSEARFNLGVVRLKRGDLEGAEETFWAAASLAPNVEQ